METTELAVPEDIRQYDADNFVRGPGAGERRLDIDDIFAKDFGRVLQEARQYHGAEFLDPKRFHTRRPSDLDEDFHFASFDGGTILIWEDENALVGGFIESDLSIDEDFQGRGLGAELVVEHFMDKGSLPTWFLDEPAYSSRGHRACLSAQAFPTSNPDAYFLKAARHLMMGNRKIFYPIVNGHGYAETLAALREALAASEPGGFADAATSWLAQLQTRVAPGRS